MQWLSKWLLILENSFQSMVSPCWSPLLQEHPHRRRCLFRPPSNEIHRLLGQVQVQRIVSQKTQNILIGWIFWSKTKDIWPQEVVQAGKGLLPHPLAASQGGWKRSNYHCQRWPKKGEKKIGHLEIATCTVDGDTAAASPAITWDHTIYFYLFVRQAQEFQFWHGTTME